MGNICINLGIYVAKIYGANFCGCVEEIDCEKGICDYCKEEIGIFGSFCN